MSDAINTTPTGFSSTLGDDLAAGQRSRKRDSLFLAARLSVGGEPATDIRVRNLSEGGLMIDNAPPMAIGTALAVELRNIGAMPGRVAWYV
ncbi:PilZ domain-containing protein, partial [Bradyrhizobium sp. IC4060]|uniref:PilZ domain-containing protein n=1 Tax=Bradyrhizobium sp. IC4060 TaxID=2793807 RepID=UPI001CD58D71